MFARQTVFVIGAGCSHEFDLPLGSTLVDQIYNTTMAKNPGFEVLRDALVRSPILGVSIDVGPLMGNFARGLHGKASIDQYLHFHRNNPLYVQLGKCAIAHQILQAERNSKLTRAKLQEGMKPVADTWLIKLFHAMNADTDIEHVEHIISNVSFICFNYDRCIEVGLFNAVRFLTGASPDRTAAAMAKLEIWHPYGTVGELDWKNFTTPNVLSGYPPNAVDWSDVLEGAKRLRTFTEEFTAEDARQVWRDRLLGAEQVVYLGFSFLDQNMRLLEARPDSSSGGPNVYATTFQMSEPNIELALSAMHTAHSPKDWPQRDRAWAFHSLNARATSFMDHWGNALRR